MKFLLLIVFILNLYGDEIQRINLSVNDIAKLRLDYKASQRELSECRKKAKKSLWVSVDDAYKREK